MAKKVEVLILGDSRSAQRAFSDLTSAARRGETQLEATSRKMQAAGAKLTRGVTLPLAAAAAGSIKAFGDFDAKMNQSIAIMGDVDDAMRTKMGDTAKQVSKDLNISASSAAEGYFFLASAGFDAAQSVAAMPQVARFAKAGMFDLATATDLATDAQSALGMKSDDAGENLENLTRVTDVLVKGNVLANASVEQFASALTNKAAAAARGVGKDIEETVAVLAAFADQGTKGQEAGTQFAIVLRDLQTRALSNAEAFKAANVQVFDQAGEMNNLADIIGQLEVRLDGMSAAERKAELATLGFTDKSIAALQALLGTSDAIRGYEEELRQAAGTTQEVSDKQMEAFNEKLGQVKQEVIGAAIEIGETLAPAALFAAETLGGLASAVASIPAPIRNTGLAFAAAAAATGPLLTVGGKAISMYSKLAKTAKTAHAALTVGSAAAQGAQAGLSGAGAAASGASAGMLSLGAAVTGVGAALALGVIAVSQYQKQQADAKRRVEEMTATLDEQTGAITDNTRAHVANRLEQEGARKAAHDLGLAFSTVVDAAMGSAAAQDEVARATARADDAVSAEVEGLQNAGREMQSAAQAGGVLAEETEKNAEAAGTLERALQGEIKTLGDATTEARRHLEAQAESENKILDVTHGIERGLDPALAHLAVQQQNATRAVDDHTEAQEDQADATDEATAALKRQEDQIRASRDALFATRQAAQNLSEAQERLKEVQDDSTASAEDLARAEDDVTRAAFDLVDSSSRLVDQLSETEGGLDAVIEELDGYVRAGLLTREEADRIAQSFRETAGAAGELDRAVGQAAKNALAELQAFRNDASAKAELIGRSIPEGIARGADATQHAAEAAVRRVVNSAIESGRRAGEIRSPSERAAREIGKPIPEGIAEGVEDGIPEVERALQDLVDQAVDAAASGVDAIVGSFRSQTGRMGAQEDLTAAEERLEDLQRRREALPADIGIVRGWVEREREQARAVTAEEEADILRASDRVRRAETALEEMRAEGTATANELRLAELEVTIARDRLTEAEKKAVGPTRELIEVQKQLRDLQDEYRTLPEEIRQAQDDLTRAQLRAIEAEKDLLESGANLIEQGPAGEEMFRNLADAAGIEQEAVDRLIRSYQQLAQARAGTGDISGAPRHDLSDIGTALTRLGVNFGTHVNPGDVRAGLSRIGIKGVDDITADHLGRLLDAAGMGQLTSQLGALVSELRKQRDVVLNGQKVGEALVAGSRQETRAS